MTSHFFLSSRLGTLFASNFARFVDVRGVSFVDFLGCGHLLFLWWLQASGSKRAGWPSMFACGFVAVHIFGQAFRQVFGQHLVCSRRPILPALVVAAHPPRKLKLRSISLRRMP